MGGCYYQDEDGDGGTVFKVSALVAPSHHFEEMNDIYRAVQAPNDRLLCRSCCLGSSSA